jgi:tetratricopeptide (TPR) repeat protein
MNPRARLLRLLVGVELAVAAVLFGLRLNSTRIDPPLVDQYSDTATGREIVALPDQFLFDSATKFRTLGETYLAFGYFSKADACLRRARESEPSNSELAFLHGFCLERLGQIDEAVTLLRGVAERRSPRLSGDAWYHVGRNLLRLERPDEAAAAFEQAGEAHWPCLYQRAKLLVRSGRAAEAAPLLAQLTSLVPNELHVLQLAEQAERALGREIAPEDHDALERASAGLKLDDAPEELNEIRDRFGLAREVAQVRSELRRRNVPAAAARLSQLVGDDTRWANRYLWLLQDAAALQLEAQNVLAAKLLVDRLIHEQKCPTPKAWEMRGEIEFAQGNHAAALEAWQHADRMRPSSDVHLRLASLARLGGIADEERRRYALAGERAGIELFRANQIADAHRTLRQALRFDEGLPEMWFYVGECERLLGRSAEADAAYRRCLELNPDHSRARSRTVRKR